MSYSAVDFLVWTTSYSCVYGPMFGENIYIYQKIYTADLEFFFLILKPGQNLKSYRSVKMTISIKGTSDGNKK